MEIIAKITCRGISVQCKSRVKIFNRTNTSSYVIRFATRDRALDKEIRQLKWILCVTQRYTSGRISHIEPIRSRTLVYTCILYCKSTLQATLWATRAIGEFVFSTFSKNFEKNVSYIYTDTFSNLISSWRKLEQISRYNTKKWLKSLHNNNIFYD